MVKLISEDGLKHRQKQMFFSTFVLVSIDCKHNSLKERVDFGHGNQTAEMGDVARLGL